MARNARMPSGTTRRLAKQVKREQHVVVLPVPLSSPSRRDATRDMQSIAGFAAGRSLVRIRQASGESLLAFAETVWNLPVCFFFSRLSRPLEPLPLPFPSLAISFVSLSPIASKAAALRPDDDFSKMRVKQLRELLLAHGEACEGCVEKRDYEQKLREAVIRTQQAR